MLTTVLGYTLPITRLSPRVYVEFDYASGDDRPGGDVETFSQLLSERPLVPGVHRLHRATEHHQP